MRSHRARRAAAARARRSARDSPNIADGATRHGRGAVETAGNAHGRCARRTGAAGRKAIAGGEDEEFAGMDGGAMAEKISTVL